MENEIKFVDGLFTKRPEKAPDFLKVKLSFNEKFIDWLKNNLNAKGWCNINVLESKNGNIYAKKDEWQPNAEQTNTNVSNNQREETLNINGIDGEVMTDEISDEVNIDNIPF